MNKRIVINIYFIFIIISIGIFYKIFNRILRTYRVYTIDMDVNKIFSYINLSKLIMFIMIIVSILVFIIVNINSKNNYNK